MYSMRDDLSKVSSTHVKNQISREVAGNKVVAAHFYDPIPILVILT